MKHIHFYTILAFVFLPFHFVIATIADASEHKYPGNNKVLLYAPGYSGTLNGRQNAITDKAKDLFNGATNFNANPVLLKDTAASVEAVKSFADYGTIIMHTHGWFWDRGEIPSVNNVPVFRTGTLASVPLDDGSCAMFMDPSSLVADQKYQQDLLNFRLGVSKKADQQCDYQYMVFPSFIDHYVSEMKDTFLYLGYCHSLQNDKMWTAFRNAGAKVAFGFSEAMTRPFNVRIFNELMTSMLPSVPNTQPATAQKAYSAILDTTDNEHKYAEFEKRVASDEWNSFVFAEPKVLRIKVENDEKSYFFLWNLDTDEEFAIYDSETGAKLSQPILASNLTATSAARYNWSPETGTPFLNTVRTASSSLWPGMGGDSSGAEDANRFISLVFDGPETERPPFSFTAQQTTAEDLVRRSEIVFGGYNEIITNDIHVYNWQEVTFLGSTAILRSTVEDLGDLERLARKFRGVGRLHFQNAPNIITYSNIHQRYEYFREGQLDCNDGGTSPAGTTEYRLTLSGESKILGEIFQSTFSHVSWHAGNGWLTSSMTYNGPYDLYLSKHGYIDTDTAKVDILLVPLFSNNEISPADICDQHNCSWNIGGCQPDGKVWSSAHPPPQTIGPNYYSSDDIDRFWGAEEIFTGFKVASGFSLKSNVMRSGAATENTWDDYSYATYSPKLSAWLATGINANFSVDSYLQIPQIFCSMNQ